MLTPRWQISSTEISHPIFGSWEDTEIIKYSSLYTSQCHKNSRHFYLFRIDTLSLLRTFWYGSLSLLLVLSTSKFWLVFSNRLFRYRTSDLVALSFYLLRILVTQPGFFPPLKSFMVLWNHSLAHPPDGCAEISTCWVSFSLKTKRSQSGS